eukprot:TRINITY_DN10524_c0_g1_i1.p1 TRINITY_DN10524_c0_g1~~TRINITY_DN10524_c0_g1_i1.p1  ORF type:complete len:107 (-),score=25.76 TRINITY_DN10524_c0_g1_i1:16-336(-)
MCIRDSMQNELRNIFDPIVQTCTVDVNRVIEGQVKLGEVLNQILKDMELIKQNNFADKDKELADYIEKVNLCKRRLANVYMKIEKIQGRVEKIEKRFVKVQAQYKV